MVLFRLYNLLTVGFFFITVLIINLIAPELGFKSLAFAIFSIVTLIIAFIPVKWGLMLTFFYIGLEGFLKVVDRKSVV